MKMLGTNLNNAYRSKWSTINECDERRGFYYKSLGQSKDYNTNPTFCSTDNTGVFSPNDPALGTGQNHLLLLKGFLYVAFTSKTDIKIIKCWKKRPDNSYMLRRQKWQQPLTIPSNTDRCEKNVIQILWQNNQKQVQARKLPHLRLSGSGIWT